MAQLFDGNEPGDARSDALLFGEQRFEIAAMLNEVALNFASEQQAQSNSREGSADKYIGGMIAGSAIGVAGYALSKALDNRFVPQIFEQGAEGAFIIGTAGIALSGLGWVCHGIKGLVSRRSST